MKRARNGYYSWPKKEDVDTVDVDFIFYSNVLLVGAGKEGGGYVDCEEDIAELFDKYKNDYMLIQSLNYVVKSWDMKQP